MPSVTYAGLYIGKLADMDPIEGTTTSTNPPENSYTVLNGRTFGSTGSPLYADSTRVTLNDTNGDGAVPYNQNTSSTETISYRLGTQSYEFKPDTTAVVSNCTIIQRLPDGSTRSVTGVTLRILQDVDGNAFVMPPRSGTDPGEGGVVQYPIISITMPTTQSSYGGTGTGISTTRQSLTGFRDGYVDGTDGNDTIDGTSTTDLDGDRVDNNDAILPGTTGNEDVIRAGLGNDVVYAGAGHDSVRGGDGNDTLYGYGRTSDDGTNDSLDGGAGDDQLYGGGGADSLLGGDGRDTLDGGIGTDTLEGGTGADSLLGGDGNDSLYGDDTAGTGAGAADTIDGGVGDDLIVGGAGGDSLLGGAGADTIRGDDTQGTDTLGGADSIDAGAGNDSVNAGAGNDTVAGGSGQDTVQGGAGADRIYGDDLNNLDPLGAADSLSGGDGDDTISGGRGDDTLNGDAGNDSLLGEADNDVLDGGDGSDTLDGGVGNDSLVGGAGNDTLNGGAGNDVVNGGAGTDLLTGGDGADTFVGGDGDTITDFNTGDDPLTRDSIDLSNYYNDTNLAAWNAANPGRQYATPLGWLRADQADGRLNMLDGTGGLPRLNMQIQNAGVLIDATELDLDNTSVQCFSADVLIDTEAGQVAAGEIAVGDMVRTRDAGLQPVRWTGARHLSAADLTASPNLRPIRIRAGALGRDVPSADLVVSPQHRVLVRSRIAQKMFGTEEVLVAAKQLLVLNGIDVAEDMDEITYVHFLFDDHQVVWSNGAETESLHTGEQALKSVGPAARAEIFAIFPDLRDGSAGRPPARTLASGRMGRKLAMRHAQSSKALTD